MGAWVDTPLRALATLNDDVLEETHDPDAYISYVEIGDVGETTGITWREPIRFGEAPSRARRRIRDGDVLVSTVRTYLRAVAGVTEAPPSPVASTGFAVLRPRAVESRFLRYALLAAPFVEEVIARSVGVSYPAINASELMAIRVPAPDEAEQRATADYLDRETAEIDAFIADQQRLIELLAERRAAAISHVLRSAPGPRVPLRRLGVRGESGTSVNGWAEPARDGEVGVLKTGAASKGYFDPGENKRVTDFDIERVTCPLREGTLLVNRANAPDLVGAAAYVSFAPPGLFLSDKLWQVEFEHAAARYVYYWTLSRDYRAQIKTLCVGASSSMQNLSYADFLDLVAPFPPIQEQQVIADYLGQETATIDATIADVRQAIALSRERRAALITAAVTGQIDVRTGPPDSVGGTCQSGATNPEVVP